VIGTYTEPGSQKSNMERKGTGLGGKLGRANLKLIAKGKNQMGVKKDVDNRGGGASQTQRTNGLDTELSRGERQGKNPNQSSVIMVNTKRGTIEAEMVRQVLRGGMGALHSQTRSLLSRRAG